jgi:2-polyprenyl-3-methyl-5-hydroxy-6-metoxy-1,4-benzoquinol methylase
MNDCCKFCNKKFKLSVIAHNFINKKKIGKFNICLKCNISIQPKLFYNLYANQKSTNYNLDKNIFFYLKQLVFFYYIFKFKKFFKKKKNILDYGCGSGELAISLSEIYKDKNIYTSDVFILNKKFIPRVKNHFLLDDKKLINKKFDVVFLRHVLEHVYDLEKFIKKIKKNLKSKNSILFIEVPNGNSLWKKIMQKRWPGYFYPYHYYVFSKKFLKNFLIRNRLKVIKSYDLEPPIIGTYLATYGVPILICKILSIFLYPIQLLISKLFFSSEAIMFVVKKD